MPSRRAIETVGLDDRADAPLRTLSGGMQQRALIAKALASEPTLLALDEPTTGVDAASQESLGLLLEALRADLGVTILYVSHEFGAVEHVVDRIVLVRGGIVYDGPPSGLPGVWHDPSHQHDHGGMLDLEFMRLALATGAVVGLLAPAVGFFLVERKASLIGDGLGHVAFAGVAFGYLLGISPVLTALVAAVIGALTIEWLRTRGGAAGDQALALVFYTGIAAGVVLVSRAGALNVNLFQFLFGSILTVTRNDLWTVARARGRRARDDRRPLPRPRRDRARRGGQPRRRRSRDAAERRRRRARRAHRGRLDADRRHPPDRGADGAAGDRRQPRRLEPAVDVRAVDGVRARLGHLGPLHRVLRRHAARRHDRPRRRRGIRALRRGQRRRAARLRS